MADSRGNPVFSISSNRSPYYFDANFSADDSVTKLLAPTASKTITVKDALGQPAVASEVQITNSSGFDCTVAFVVAKANISGQGIQSAIDGNGYFHEGSRGPVQTETTLNPVRILNGESWVINARVLAVTEKNVGASTQTGNGVRYLFTIEPASR